MDFMRILHRLGGATEVIPAVNVDNFEEVVKRIKAVEPYVRWVQLDIADGTFTKNTTWHNPEDLLSIETPLKIEVHLMVLDIEKRLENWLLPCVNRIIFHLEAAKDPDFVINECRKAKKEVGISIVPDTPWVHLVPYLQKADLFQILGVYPGLAGQKFQEECFGKIVHLRKHCQYCIIEVDGGMDKIIAQKAIQAGANIINAASAIFGSGDIKKAIKELSAKS